MKRVELVSVPLEANQVREIALDGKQFSGMLGPFDFPERLRICLNEKGDRGTVEFLYAIDSDEDIHVTTGPRGSTLYSGAKSGRVIRLEFPVPPTTNEAHFGLGVMTEEPLSELKRNARGLSWEERPARRVAHYEMFPALLSFIEDRLGKLRSQQRAR